MKVKISKPEGIEFGKSSNNAPSKILVGGANQDIR